MKAILSDQKISLRLPLNFLKVLRDLSPQAAGLLLGYFQFMSAQEKPGTLCLAFDLKNYLAFLYAHEDDAFQSDLKELVEKGFLLLYPDPEAEEKIYLLPGSSEGANWLKILREKPETLKTMAVARVLPAAEKPNVFRLYQENIGPLTPFTAELLRDAAASYSEEWLEDAIKEAVLYNARNWKYVQAILQNWKAEGRKRSNEEDKRDHESFRKLYLDQKRKKRS